MADDAAAPRQRSPLTIVWWGHATVEIRLDGARLLTDPLLRRRIGPLHSVGHLPRRAQLRSVDAVLLSHLHRDHTDLPSIANLDARTRVIVPVGGGRLLRSRARGRVEELATGQAARIGVVEAQATSAVHDGRRRFGQDSAEAVGYLLRGSRTVYFAGDTDIFGAMSTLAGDRSGGIDVALLPVSGWGLTLGPGHMDPERAAEAVGLLRPRVAIPIHWGTLRLPVLWRARPGHSTGAPHSFAALAARTAPETRVVIPRPGRPILLLDSVQDGVEARANA